MTFEEVKKDYLELIRKHGDPYDITGGFELEVKALEVILNPSKRASKKLLTDLLQYGFQHSGGYQSESNGFISVNDCPLVMRLYKKYML
jgi:hypothetical protein